MLGGGLEPSEYALLRDKGPYTRSPARVKQVLHPAAVKVSLAAMMKESMGFVKQAEP